MPSRSLHALLIPLGLLLAFPAFAGGEEPVTRPHLDQTTGARSISLRGRAFVNRGLVGVGRLPADTVDFLGDTLDFPDDRRDYGELRIITIGHLRGRMVIVVWTPRGSARHVISMRRANAREKARFGKRLEES